MLRAAVEIKGCYSINGPHIEKKLSVQVLPNTICACRLEVFLPDTTLTLELNISWPECTDGICAWQLQHKKKKLRLEGEPETGRK